MNLIPFAELPRFLFIYLFLSNYQKMPLESLGETVSARLSRIRLQQSRKERQPIPLRLICSRNQDETTAIARPRRPSLTASYQKSMCRGDLRADTATIGRHKHSSPIPLHQSPKNSIRGRTTNLYIYLFIWKLDSPSHQSRRQEVGARVIANDQVFNYFNLV